MMNRVVLRKLKNKSKRYVGHLRGIPTKGRKVVLDLEDDSEYVTTAVVRILQLVNDHTLYIETANTRYSMRVKR